MAQDNRPGEARSVAIRALARVLSDGEPLDQVLAQLSGEVNPLQRGWLQEVCSGTLRWKGRLDQAIDSGALKKKPSGWLRRALLVGAYQLIGQERTSPAAVVSESVNEVKRKEGESPAKFVNASLRKIADHAAEWRALPFPSGASAADQARWASLPEWFWSRLVKDHGSDWARQFALASLDRPAMWLRARREQWKPEWAEPGPVARSWKASAGGSIPDKAGFAEGEFIVQDISSQILVSEISAAVRERGGRVALDLCAAPGGKSVGMAWVGLDVYASDRDPKRLQLLRQTLERAPGTRVSVIAREEVAALPEQDLVWIDAPCSGSGIIRRHPDVRWLRQERDLDQLEPIQAELIQEGWRKVRPGGLLAYSVCSVFKAEGERQLERAQLGGNRIKDWSLFPQDVSGGDGFWAILLEKSR